MGTTVTQGQKSKSSDGLVRKFRRAFRNSGTQQKVRSRRYRMKTQNRRTRRADAIRRMKNREQRELDIKTGRIQVNAYGKIEKKR